MLDISSDRRVIILLNRLLISEAFILRKVLKENAATKSSCHFFLVLPCHAKQGFAYYELSKL